MQTIINRISIAVILLVVVVFLVDKSYLGFYYTLIGVIPYVCFMLMANYIGKLEKKVGIDKKVETISWICFWATLIIGILLISSFPEFFLHLVFSTIENGF